MYYLQITIVALDSYLCYIWFYGLKHSEITQKKIKQFYYTNTMVNLWLTWLQEPLAYFFIIIGLICVKTMANFCKWTLKLGENNRCVGGGEIITYIKTRY